MSSANPGNINAAASGVFVPLADGTDIIVGAGAGGTTTLSVYLGDVINSDNDANLELYTLEYRAVVQNVAGNQTANHAHQCGDGELLERAVADADADAGWR